MLGKENAGDWIERNKPENGKFKVYYTEDAIKMDAPNSSFGVMTDISKFPKELEDGVFYSFEDTGLGLRYEWEYVNGKQHGRARSYFSNGQLRVECNYNHGVLFGVYVDYFFNGMLREKISYNNGVEVGERKQWYMENNNALKWIINYTNGKKDGNSILYYMDGTIKMEGQYGIIVTTNYPVDTWKYHYTHDDFETTTIYSGKVLDMEETLDKKYKKVPNNENAIEIDGKVVLSFDPRYKEYLKWRDENFDGNMDDGDYLCWSEEEEDWIKNRGWHRMERPCSSWVRIEKGKIVEEVKFKDIGFCGKFGVNTGQ